jgi:hypothetical protein
MNNQDYIKYYLAFSAGVAVAYNCYSTWKFAKTLKMDVPNDVRRDYVRERLICDIPRSALYGLIFPLALPLDIYVTLVSTAVTSM